MGHGPSNHDDTTTRRRQLVANVACHLPTCPPANVDLVRGQDRAAGHCAITKRNLQNLAREPGGGNAPKLQSCETSPLVLSDDSTTCGVFSFNVLTVVGSLVVYQ